MPKFCQKCGAMTDDNAAFCGSCGATMKDNYYDEPTTVVAQDDNPYYYEPEQSAQPSYQEAPASSFTPVTPMYEQPPVPVKKKKKTGMIIVISIIALVVVAALVLIVILPLAGVDVFGLKLFGTASSMSSPKDCVQGFLDELAEDNTDGALDYMYETKYSDWMRSLMKNQFEEKSDSNSGFMAIRSMGKDNLNSLIDISVSNEEELSQSETDSYKEKLQTMTIPIDKIEKIEKADVTMTNKTSTGQTQNKKFYFVYAEGEWYILASALSTTS